MEPWDASLDALARETGFSGVIRVDVDTRIALARAYGYADRAHEIDNTLETQFGIASGTKGLTALLVMTLVEAGILDRATTARSLLGTDLPLIGDAVTVEHLLAHRSGIGDYVDEDAHPDPDTCLLPGPAHELATAEQYLPALDGHPAKFEPGDRFSYCNGGYVVLALIAERATGVPFHQLIAERVCDPAGMHDTAFLRSDALPGRAALGYLPSDADDQWRTNVFHLPVRGSGDGGIYSTAADIHALWTAAFDGRIVSTTTLTDMIRPRSDVPSESMRYGLGFWLHATGPAVMLEGCDAGVSFRSVHHAAAHTTHTVISNTSDGAWPITRRLDELLEI
jgi:CubicO group peptidase (beta-lactamase class C family)